MPGYHIALIVEDLERATSELSAGLGLTWAKVQRRDVTRHTDDGRHDVEFAFVYSLQGPPYMELIEQRRDDPLLAELGLHHIGVWCDDDRPAESARLEGLGFPLESVNVGADGAWTGGLYHQVGGLRVELVDMGRSGPGLCRYLAGGDYGPAPTTTTEHGS
jgi:catechol 2,3-dioxygenase-like lactoylglutathione lyase family enzyme